MPNIWDRTINISQATVIDLVQLQLGIKVEDIKLIGEGFDNVAYLINNQIIFRFPRREIAVSLLQTELELLPYIASKISFNIPNPQFIGKPSQNYPFPFAGYFKILGSSLCDIANPLIDSKALAKELASWLKELHSIEIKPDYQYNTEDNWRLDTKNRLEKATQTINQYKTLYAKNGFNPPELIEVIQSFRNLKFKDYKPCHIHGDLYYKHIMVDENLQATGLIDWGDTHVGHPDIDIAAALMIFTDEALEEFFQTYGSIDKTVAAFRSLCHGLTLLPYAAKQEDLKLMNWSISALNRSIQIFRQECL